MVSERIFLFYGYMKVLLNMLLKVLFLRSDVRPNHFIHTSGHNATQAKKM